MALPLADAEAVVAGALAEAVPVVVAVAVAVPVAVPVGLLVVLAGVPLSPLLVLPLGGLVAELAGATVGVCDLLGEAETDADELGAHADADALLEGMVAACWVRSPFVAPCWLADPAGPARCEEVIPTAALSW